ncbi:hypothetical protein PIB30_015749 [Stylosanthes scabra]|uniref:SHSP domain-containing protein n=1 Tax=Stylosanthes scabra TaxID=79078 RepID=A0ABU6X4Q3_9FABA|nr:hypothetical protein [Stylosanthes scabra]
MSRVFLPHIKNKAPSLSLHQPHCESANPNSSLNTETTTTMSLIPTFFGRRPTPFDPFSLDAWDPFEDFPFPPLPVRHHHHNQQLFPAESSSFLRASVDWKETPAAHVFKADVPGLKKEEVKVEIEDDRVLRISGERNRESEERNDTWHRVERSSGRFERSFRLPENAMVDKVKAAMEDGVLTVTVPKKENRKKADVRSVKISG